MTDLHFENVSITYRSSSDRGDVVAVEDVSLDLPAGATLGIAGESGSGKSTLIMSALRLLPKAVFGVLLALEPVIAALAGWLLLDQGFGLTRAVAVLLVVVAGAGSAITASAKDEMAGVVAEDAPDEVAASAHP